MSIVVCDHCDKYIDSDFDCDCFSVDPFNSKDVTTLCESCREKAYERQQERLMEDGPGPSLLEQQQAARRFK